MRRPEEIQGVRWRVWQGWLWRGWLWRLAAVGLEMTWRDHAVNGLDGAIFSED